LTGAILTCGDGSTPASATPPAREVTRRPGFGAGALLLAAYVVLSFLWSPKAFMGPDEGGKVATLRSMAAHSTLVPRVGYWAAADDPHAVLHALTGTGAVHGNFVQVTSVPMMIVAAPLWRLGGYHAVLLFAMLGGVACAFAAAALARRLGFDRSVVVFWVVGLASPVLLYSIDFWEHTAGLALMLFAVVLLLDVLERDAPARVALVSGLLFGLAATMRTEALVYWFGATAVVLAIALFGRRRPFVRVVTTGVASLGGLLVALGSNAFLERVLFGGSIRGGRTSALATSSGSALSQRVHEAVTTTLGSGLSPTRLDELFGVLIVVLLAAAGFGVVRGWDRTRIAALVLGAGIVVLGRAATGLVFVPGFAPAFPLAAVGIGAGIGSRRQLDRVVTVIALVGLPLVWATDYLGSKDAQWGGRYLLCSSVLLAVVGLVTMLGRFRAVAWATVVLCVAITLNGLVFMHNRSHDLAHGWAQLSSVHADVVVSEIPPLFREMGAYYRDDAHWLTVHDKAQLATAATIAEHHDARSLAVLLPDGDRVPSITGWQQTSTRVERMPYYGAPAVVTYGRTP